MSLLGWVGLSASFKQQVVFRLFVETTTVGSAMAGSEFGLSSFQLVELMSEGGKEGAARIAELGGVKGIAEQLGSDTRAGISNNVAQIEAR